MKTILWVFLAMGLVWGGAVIYGSELPASASATPDAPSSGKVAVEEPQPLRSAATKGRVVRTLSPVKPISRQEARAWLKRNPKGPFWRG